MEVVLTKKAAKQYKKLNVQIQHQISDKLKKFENEVSGFDQYTKMKIVGYNDRYKIGSGNYRVIIKRTSNVTGEIIAIAHRKDVYNNLFSLIFSV